MKILKSISLLTVLLMLCIYAVGCTGSVNTVTTSDADTALSSAEAILPDADDNEPYTPAPIDTSKPEYDFITEE